MWGTNKMLAAGWATVGALVALSVGAIIATVRAQEPPLPPAPGGNLRVGQGPRFGGGNGGATMIATDKNVFVLRGNTLYQYDPQGGLSLRSQVELPAPSRMQSGN